ncbi:hypothetical protein LZ30DRAFT_601687, partial [Colletotrichum cereale]
RGSCHNPFQIYQKDDAPLYRRDNKVILGLIFWNAVPAWLIKAYYVRRNSTRDRIWNAMSQEKKDRYLTTTADEGSRRLDFRFAH